MSRTVFSALSGMRLLACLIVAPRWGYDEPKILSYAISPFVRQALTAYNLRLPPLFGLSLCGRAAGCLSVLF